MCKDDYSTFHGPSKQLAAAVAEKVMGWHVESLCDDYAEDIAESFLTQAWWFEHLHSICRVRNYRPDLPDSPASQLRDAEISLREKERVRYVAEVWTVARCCRPVDSDMDRLWAFHIVEPWRACVCLLLAKQCCKTAGEIDREVMAIGNELLDGLCGKEGGK